MRHPASGAQLTYRYLRLSLIAMVLLLAVAVAVEMAAGTVLGSISAYFYTPARDVFVGAVIGVSIALIAITGSRGIEDLLLNLAGVVAPVIAVVPTPLAVGFILPGRADAVACEPGLSACIPSALRPDVINAMTALLVVGALALVAALVFVLVERALTRLVAAGLAATALIVTGTAAWLVLGFASFSAWAHYIATGLFFTLIIAIVFFNALFVRRPETAVVGMRRQRFAVVYTIIAVGMALCVLAGVVAVVLQNAVAPDADGGLFFWCEAVGLALFAVFWLFQTIQKWRDPLALVLPRAQA